GPDYRVAPPSDRTDERRQHAPEKPAGHLGESHRPPEHIARAHGAAGLQPRVDRRYGQPGGHRARLHGSGATGATRERTDVGGDAMTWLAWRQFRLSAGVTAAALAALAVLVVVTGRHLVHVYDASGIAG